MLLKVNMYHIKQSTKTEFDEDILDSTGLQVHVILKFVTVWTPHHKNKKKRLKCNFLLLDKMMLWLRL